MNIFKRSEEGTTIVLFAFSLMVLLGIAGLAADASLLWTVQRQMQNAADGAAIAASRAWLYGQDYTAAAKDVASFNGFTDGSNSVKVTVNNPPADGAYVGNSSFVEVIVSQAQPTLFMRVFGMSTVNLAARAVAGSGANGTFCLYALDPKVSGAIHTDGGNSLNSTCGIMANSSSSNAITSNGKIIAPIVGAVGGASGTIRAATKRYGVAPAPDPLAYLKKPTAPSTCDKTNYSISSGSVTLGPAVAGGTFVFCRGLTMSGSAILTLKPGTYILKGRGLTMNGNATLTGKGVTIFNTAFPPSYPFQPIYTQDQANLYLSAPTSGPYTGILLWGDPAYGAGVTNVIGGGTSKLEGVLYFPNQILELSSGSAVNAAYTIMVAAQLHLLVNQFNVANDYSLLSGGSPIKATRLYE